MHDGTLPPLRKLLRSYKYKYNLCAHVVNHGVAGRQATASVSYAMNICACYYISVHRYPTVFLLAGGSKLGDFLDFNLELTSSQWHLTQQRMWRPTAQETISGSASTTGYTI